MRMLDYRISLLLGKFFVSCYVIHAVSLSGVSTCQIKEHHAEDNEISKYNYMYSDFSKVVISGYILSCDHNIKLKALD